MQHDLRPLDRIHWISVINGDTDPVPPFAALMALDIDSDGNIVVQRPDSDSMIDILINGYLSIAPGLKGSATRDLPMRILFDLSFGTYPNAGEIWGTQADSWFLGRTKDGFKAMGAVDVDNNSCVFTGRDHSLEKLVQITSLTKTRGLYPAVELIYDVVTNQVVQGEVCWYANVSELS